MTIESFRKEYRFLSNFYKRAFYHRGLRWETSEHFFQAHKTKDYDEFDKILIADTPSKAKRLGRKCSLRSDWDDVKDDIMYMAVLCKFSQNPILKRKLLETGERYLIEGNTWHDNYWGNCTCDKCNTYGRNKLGLILMKVRDIIE